MSETTQDKIQWLLCEWHAISTSKPPIQMNGVLFQDILTITKKILEDKYTIDFTNAIDALYKHVMNFNNPHEVSIDDFNVSVIELLYVVFANEGYSGTLNEFIDRIFFYVQIGTYEDILNSEDTESGYSIVTTVKMVFDYIQNHNNRIDTHRVIVDRLFQGIPYIQEPQLILEKYIGTPLYLYKDYYKPETYCYYNYPLNDNGRSIGNEFTIVVTLPIPKYSGYNEAFGYIGWDKAKGFDQLPFGNMEEVKPFWGINYSDDLVFGFEGQANVVGFNKSPFVREKYVNGNWVNDPLGGGSQSIAPGIFLLKDSATPTSNFLMSYNTITLNLSIRYKVQGSVINSHTINISDILKNSSGDPYISVAISVDEEKMTILTEYETITQNHMQVKDISLPDFDTIDIPAIGDNSLLNTFAFYPSSVYGDNLTYLYNVYDRTIRKIA